MPESMDFEMPEMPDMGDLFSELSESMEAIPDMLEEAQKALGQLDDMGQLNDLMSAMAGMTAGMPSQLAGLEGALGNFGELHAANAAQLAGDPDWELKALIRVGKVIEAEVSAVFDFQKVLMALESTENPEMDSVIGGVLQNVAGLDLEAEPGLQDQIMQQLKQGRGMAIVQNVDVLSCTIQGAPVDAAEKLQLSPEANIGLSAKDGNVRFEFAHMLTVKNRWENASVPAVPLTEAEVVVPVSSFEAGEAFTKQFTVDGDDVSVSLEISFNQL